VGQRGDCDSMSLYTIKTAPCTNPRFRDYTMISWIDSETKTHLVVLPVKELTGLMQRRGQITGDVAPYAPYPLRFLGMCDWKCNKTDFAWLSRRVTQIYDASYKSIVEMEIEAKEKESLKLG